MIPKHFPISVLVGIIGLGLILRGPLVAVSPVSALLGADLHISSAQVGLLTAVPVLCFAVIAPAASALVGHFGANLTTVIAIVGVGLGIILRSSGGTGLAFTGTLIMGACITIGNVVAPVIIRRDIPQPRVTITTSSYSASLNLGSMIGALATAPIALWLGWRLGLGAMLLLVLFALLAWIIAVRKGGTTQSGFRLDRAAASAAAESTDHRWLTKASLLLAIAFAGQAFAYYGATAWLPRILSSEDGFSTTIAGATSSIFQVLGIVSAIAIPFAVRRTGIVMVMVITAALWFTFVLGLILAPQAWLAWTILGGIGQAGGITLMLLLIVELSTSDSQARKVSALVQGVGYAVAASAPTLLGLLHDVSGGWLLTLLALLAAVIVLTSLGIPAAVLATKVRQPINMTDVVP